jgi:hypothetical protein
MYVRSDGALNIKTVVRDERKPNQLPWRSYGGVERRAKGVSKVPNVRSNGFLNIKTVDRRWPMTGLGSQSRSESVNNKETYIKEKGAASMLLVL